MRNPLPVLAAVFLAAAGAFAADLPTWTPKDEPYESWRLVNFVDEAGGRHQLYCRWAECGSSVKKGNAKLYVLERVASENFTLRAHPWLPKPGGYDVSYWDQYSGAVWKYVVGEKQTATKTTYSTRLSQYVLDMSDEKAVTPDKSHSFAVVYPEEVSAPGSLSRVLAPLGTADDLPKTKPGGDTTHTHTGTGHPATASATTPETAPATPATTAPATPPTTAPAPGAGADTRGAPDLTKLTKEEKAAYDKEIADDKGDAGKIVATNLKYRKILALRDMATFGTLSGLEKIDVCAPYKNSGGGESVAPKACDPAVQVEKTAQCKRDAACIDKLAKECGTAPVAGASTGVKSSLPPIDPAVLKACFPKPDLPEVNPPPGASKMDATGTVPNPPCGAAKAKASGAADADASAQPGKDEDPCPKPKDPKPDKKFYTNMGNGVAFGLGGLLLASFFGGPALMLAVAVTAGVGAYYVSKSITEPPDDTKKK